MSRRVSLPGADELFRATSSDDKETEADDRPGEGPDDRPDDRDAMTAAEESSQARTSSGRVKHDEKMTVYVTADELIEIEHARLVLRRVVGGAVDRGRLVRIAVAMALADLDERGIDSELARRLRRS
ncbi:MAG: hypothetical protein M3510_03455 [Actinomycetota bacterium]|nr:hypothetical protein [Actinomycetota bacterium]